MLASYRTHGQGGVTPLMRAIDTASKACVEALIDGRVEINFQNTVCPGVVPVYL